MRALSKILPRGVSISLLLLIGLLSAFLIFLKKKTISAMEYDLLIQKILQDNGYAPNLARLFAAVSRHETGNYTSSVLKSANNLFGMKFPKIRQTTAQNEDPSGYSVYTSKADSVRDLVLYLNALDYPSNFRDAAALVSYMKEKNYFEADLSEYLTGVERALPKVAVL